MVFAVKADLEMVTLWEIAAQEMFSLQRTELSKNRAVTVCREPDVSADQEAFNLQALVLEHLCPSPSP